MLSYYSTLCESSHADDYLRNRGQNYHCLPSKFCLLTRASEMRKSNYSLEKRQRDIAKQKKSEAKRLRRPDKADQSDRVETSNDLV